MGKISDDVLKKIQNIKSELLDKDKGIVEK